MKKNLFKTILILVSASFTTLSVSAAIHVFPGESIQEAVDEAAASPGADVIYVHAGTYDECLLINDADTLKLVGIGDVIIRCDIPDGNSITITGGDVILVNLVVTADNDGIGATDMDSLTLLRVQALECGDEGFDIENVEVVNIISCLVQGNAGHGMQIDNGDFGRVRVVRSQSLDNGGDGVKVQTVDHCLIVGVVAINNDDGMDLDGIVELDIRNSTSNGNADEGIEGAENGTVIVVGTTCNGNAGEGLDFDDVIHLALLHVRCSGNAGSGFQSIAETVATEEIILVNCLFELNGKHGMDLGEVEVEDQVGGSIASVELRGVCAIENVERGFNILISGVVQDSGISSENNGAPDIFP